MPSSCISRPEERRDYEPLSPSALLKKKGVISSASVKFFLSLTQKPEQSKLTNPHYITPSAISEANERNADPYLVKIDTYGVRVLIYCWHAAKFPKLRTRKGCPQPSSIYVKPYVRIVAHSVKREPSDQKQASGNRKDTQVSPISSMLSIAPLEVVPIVPTETGS